MYKVIIDQECANSLGVSNANRARFIAAVLDQLDHAYSKHGSELWSRHEFYGILKEEVDEVFDNIKQNGSKEDLIAEMIQVAATCLRYAESLDRYSKQPFVIDGNRFNKRIINED